MNLNDHLVFIPIEFNKSHHDMQTYFDWDDAVGYGGQQISIGEEGIVVLAEQKQQFLDHIKEFQKWANK